MREVEILRLANFYGFEKLMEKSFEKKNSLILVLDNIL